LVFVRAVGIRATFTYLQGSLPNGYKPAGVTFKVSRDGYSGKSNISLAMVPVMVFGFGSNRGDEGRAFELGEVQQATAVFYPPFPSKDVVHFNVNTSGKGTSKSRRKIECVVVSELERMQAQADSLRYARIVDRPTDDEKARVKRKNMARPPAHSSSGRF